MSFINEFNDSVYEPWHIEYVAYETIYEGLEENCVTGKWTSQDEKDFEAAIRLEAGKVDLFINRKQREIESRIVYCERTLFQQKNLSESARESTDDALTDILADLNELARFTRINFKAIQRLIEKHDELLHTDRQSLFVDICRTRPLDNQRFDNTLIRLSSLLDICRNRLNTSSTQSKEIHTDKRSFTARYWVHQDNLTEVKAIMLFNLPMQAKKLATENIRNDYSTSIVYLDNDKFSLYSEKLQCDNGAEIIKCSWHGSLESAEKVSIARKKFVKTDQGGTSFQDRIILEPSRVADFIAQRFPAEEYANDLKSNDRCDQAYVNQCYTIAKSLQQSISKKHLKPKLRVYFNRLRFEAPQDRNLSVTLDSDVALIREDRGKKDPEDWCRADVKVDYPFKKLHQDEVCLFPHSVLEVNVLDGQVPLWLSRLLESKLVYGVPRFSTYLHGVSQFWRPMLPLLPWWLPRMEVDIRKGQRTEVQNTAFSGLTRSKSLRPLIDGQYRLGYLESQLGDRHRRSINKGRENIDTRRADDEVEKASTQHSNLSLQRTRSSVSATSKTKLRARHVDTDSGHSNNRNSKFLQSYYDGRNNQSQAYRLQNADTVGENDATRQAAIIEMEEDVGNKGKGKKPKPRTHTMEPKQFFANERTFINWLQFSAIILTAALTLLNFGDRITTITGATFFGVSLVIALYAFFRYRYRAYQMSTRPDIRYDDLYGPIGLVVLLVGAMILNFVLRFVHPSPTDSYLGINNTTDQQPNNQTSV
ncbi:unnamed protein product [Mucor hiemalis]